ncbi:MAG: neutral/alkaline non-lysosomal ceramidase N-terminal domain-containing protein, partial [Spirochaetaceae bacterium]|nr:neutral/alkaline non-lysosomal ceramidase N-terminal domain-containing protein [Spirochaetaceae bacterium]
MNHLSAGSAVVDITPVDSQFLFGYPHVERYSTGVKNPLFSSSLYLENGNDNIMFIANDIIFVNKELCGKVRKRIVEAIGIPEGSIMITATHTHSGPNTVNYLSNSNDSIVPDADPAYLKLFEDGMVESGIQAFHNRQPAQAGLIVADGKGVGTNRRDSSGPADPQVPVLLVQAAETSKYIACMLVYSMHPTVLHEDSTLISGDFPSFTREYLQKELLGNDCPVLYHTGPEGNQSPRHVTSGNTFAEAKRLGELLGQRIESVIGTVEYSSSLELAWQQGFINPSIKKMPTLGTAEVHLK